MRKFILSSLALSLITAPALAAEVTGSFYKQGLALYSAGHYPEATDAFEKSIKRRDHLKESQKYLEMMRKETVNKIRNNAVEGPAKTNWQSKFYFMNVIDDRIRVGISLQELFDRDSLNFRPGAVEALRQIVEMLQRSGNSLTAQIEVINEVPQETLPDQELLNQQLATTFAVLSETANTTLTKR